jgi:pSer/pThr/pTyr-binding forkhead associated (FHA) protein
MPAENSAASITLSLGTTLLQQVPLAKERVTLGRRPHNDVVVDHPAVSAEHAVIVTIAGDSFLEDLNSTNGTLVNGQRVKKHFLQSGDLIELATYSVRYHAAPRPDNAAPVVAAPAKRGIPAATAPVEKAGTVATTATTTAAPTPTNTAAGAAPRSAIVKVLNGASAGRELILSKPLTSLGRPGVQVAVILNLPEGYCLRHIEGAAMPLLNGKSVGASTTPLSNGDVIDLAGAQMQFVQP